MSYTICSRFKGEHIVYAGYTICTSREHIVYGAFCGSTVLASPLHFSSVHEKHVTYGMSIHFINKHLEPLSTYKDIQHHNIRIYWLGHHHFSVIVTVCRGPCSLGIYSTHSTPSFMHPLWLQKRNSGCILPLSYAYFALSESVGHRLV